VPGADAVHELVDREEIDDCVHKYARGIDRLDEALLLEAFHDDAMVDYATARFDFVGTIQEFVALAWKNQENFHSTQHHLMNQTVEIDDNTAHAETYYLTVSRSKDRKRVAIGGGRYVDRLERRDGEWRIAMRMTVGEWGTELANEDWEYLAKQLPRRDRDDPSYMRPLQLPVTMTAGPQ
jgi:hypothetical protein